MQHSSRCSPCQEGILARTNWLPSALQFFSVYQGCPNTARLPEFLVSLDSNASFVTTNVVRGGGAAAAVAFRDASFNLILPNAQFRLQNTTFWYARGGHSGALAVIADVESRVAAGRLQWAYGAAVNPNGTFPESSWSGMLTRNTTALPTSPGACQPGSISETTILEGLEVGSNVSRSTSREQSTGVPDEESGGAGSRGALTIAAVCGGVLFGLLLIAFVLVVLVRGGRARRQAAREGAWKALDRTWAGGVLYGSGSAMSAVLDVRSAAAGSSMLGAGAPATGASFSSQGHAADAAAHDVLPRPGPARTGARGERSTPSGVLCDFAGGVSPHAGAPSADLRTEVRGGGSAVAAAVQEMQGALQAELQEDQLTLYSVIGRGGLGNVYQGVRPFADRVFLTGCGCGHARRRRRSAVPHGRAARAVLVATLRVLLRCACMWPGGLLWSSLPLDLGRAVCQGRGLGGQQRTVLVSCVQGCGGGSTSRSRPLPQAARAATRRRPLRGRWSF